MMNSNNNNIARDDDDDDRHPCCHDGHGADHEDVLLIERLLMIKEDLFGRGHHHTDSRTFLLDHDDEGIARSWYQTPAAAARPRSDEDTTTPCPPPACVATKEQQEHDDSEQLEEHQQSTRRRMTTDLLVDVVANVLSSSALLMSSCSTDTTSSHSSRTRRLERIDHLYKIGKEKIRSTLPPKSSSTEIADTSMEKERLHRLASSLPLRTRAGSTSEECFNRLYSIGKERNSSKLPLLVSAKEKEEISAAAESRRLHTLARSALKKSANHEEMEGIDRLYNIGKNKIRSSRQVSSSLVVQPKAANKEVREQNKVGMERRLHRLTSSPSTRRRSDSFDHLYTLGKEKIRSSLPLTSSQKKEQEKQERDRLHRLAVIQRENSTRNKPRCTDRLYEIGKEQVRLERIVDLLRRNE
eukprot:CAMPEP_0176486968 /NCGR_PEP_ID=MMETSP0200_2-20121128/5863_1 /TAXON_ID=947934 /ORGANISM="Chaetoceros sp., Strain GSL56" /LENGTH=411 /DNA_ID=CAMNT_0017883729 /DNA_START=289 /DNA_END=1524 /DNA_ORIENTATION=-